MLVQTISFLLAVAQTIDSSGASDVPEEFRGNWRLEGTSCEREDLGFGRQIRANGFEDYDVGGHNIRVELISKNRIFVRYQFYDMEDIESDKMSNAAELWTLSSGGKRLEVNSAFSDQIYLRCNSDFS